MKLIFSLFLAGFVLTVSGQVPDSTYRKAYNKAVVSLASADTTGLHATRQLLASAAVAAAFNHSLQGHLASASGDYELACKLFSQALQENDTLSDALLGRALASGKAGLFDQARADLNRLVEMRGADPYLFKLRGIAALEMVDYEAAVEDFKNGLLLAPSDAELNYLSALVRYKTDNYPEAYDNINKALTSDSLNAQYFYLRGSILMALEKNKDALADYNRALSLRPGYADALAMKGFLFYRTGDTDQALITLKLATDADPDFALPWFYTGLCQVEKELPSDALRSFDRASRLGYDDGDIFHYRGLAFIQLRRYDDACKSWKDAVLRGYRLSKALSRRYCQP